MSDSERMHERTDGPVHSFCWGEEYLEDGDAEPWQANLVMPGDEVVLSGCGKTRQGAIDDLKAKIPFQVREVRQRALLELELLGAKARFMEEFLNPNVVEKPAFGVRGTFLYIPREIGGPDIDGFDHVFRVRGLPSGARDFRFCMEDLEAVIATDYAVLYDEDGKRRLGFPRPTLRGRKLINKLEETP